jgi:hypothetical protein
MTEEIGDAKTARCEVGKCFSGGMFQGVYGMAFIGAAVYFLQDATTFGGGALGLLKAIVWPALLIHKVFTMLNM